MTDRAAFLFWRNKAAAKRLPAKRKPITRHNLCKALASFLTHENLTLTDAEIGLAAIEIGTGQ
jgi:hypothetical protein